MRLRRGAAVAMALLATVVAGGCDQATTRAEDEKAEELQQALAPLGIDIETGVAVSLYGTDGGAVCAEADQPDVVASEAAAVVGHRFTLRKTKADLEDVAYVRAVIETYCPDELSSFEDYVRDIAVDESDN